MIITRSPLRITLGGGGTDLPPYVHEHGGFCLSAAIDKYIYITLHRRFDKQLVVKYSDVERVNHASELRHPLTREALGLLGMDGKGLEIASHADIPAGTGLGSSAAFTCALLAALDVSRCDGSSETLGDRAYEVEVERCQEPVGKQDPYISALGGIQAMTFCANGGITLTPLGLDDDLAAHLLLFFTGQTRRAREILQVAPKMPWDEVKALGQASREALAQGKFEVFADLLTQQWMLKRSASPRMTNTEIDGWFNRARLNGALGGKLCGAGGGGFLLFYAEDPQRLIQAMPLPHVPFKFDWEGTKVLVS